MDIKTNELLQEFRDRQEKLTYYIIALCVTAIGFSIHKTTGAKLDLILIPLGLAVLSWGISVFCGINFVKCNLNALKMASSDQNSTKQEWEENSDSATFYIRSQHEMFYLGIILFIIWHLCELS